MNHLTINFNRAARRTYIRDIIGLLLFLLILIQLEKRLVREERQRAKRLRPPMLNA